MGVLQTTVAEIVTVKEHQRTWSEFVEGSIQAHIIQREPTLSCLLFGASGKSSISNGVDHC